jgi:hypothetical protein
MFKRIRYYTWRSLRKTSLLLMIPLAAAQPARAAASHIRVVVVAWLLLGSQVGWFRSRVLAG